MGRSKFDPDTYIEWLDKVTPESRELLAKVFSENPVTNYDELITFSQRVMVEVLCGNIAPCVADAAARWAEIMMTALAAKNTANGTPGEAYSDLLNALIAVQEEAPVLEATYTETEVIDLEAVGA